MVFTEILLDQKKSLVCYIQKKVLGRTVLKQLTVAFKADPIAKPSPSEQNAVMRPVNANKINLFNSKSCPDIKYVIVMKIVPKNIWKLKLKWLLCFII